MASYKQLLVVRKSSNIVTRYQYDRARALVDLTDAHSIQTTYHHDGFARLVASDSPDSGTSQFIATLKVN